MLIGGGGMGQNSQELGLYYPLDSLFGSYADFLAIEIPYYSRRFSGSKIGALAAKLNGISVGFDSWKATTEISQKWNVWKWLQISMVEPVLLGFIILYLICIGY